MAPEEEQGSVEGVRAPSAVPATAGLNARRVNAARPAAVKAEEEVVGEEAVVEAEEDAVEVADRMATIVNGRQILPRYCMEEEKMKLTRSRKKGFLFFGIAVALTCMAAMALSASVSVAAKGKQETFATPEDAVKALVDVVKTNNTKELLAILGPGSESVVSSGDAVRDKASREHFIQDFEEKHSLEKQGDNKVVLHVGKDNFPFPIPIVKKGTVWYFDTKEGKEELINRRIGADELNVINSLYVFVNAQWEYISENRDGTRAFAQKFMSSPGKHDGLYWETKAGVEESPLGPFVARASTMGYGTKERSEKPAPFHGYYFKVLNAQGPDATGGAYDYVVKGKMILGFAFLSYPANYGSSGIMTFIVNQQGVIYQKDLGNNTTQLAKAIKKYNPDKTWKKVKEPEVSSQVSE